MRHAKKQGSPDPVGHSKSHRETDETYRGELFRHGRHRVVTCREGIQWILQRRKARLGTVWEAIGYCRTRMAPIALWTAATGVLAPELATLPEHFGKGAVNE